ncbi:hypothetical protein BVC80_1065g4 [Macleaya cordata]|uniref:Uncharacterized protein n=1 Tax=Macleaya cordata TaxID=56857 RepID=A0A200RCL5_MACCD|nr:hypothetical protein BVC80_1065g4 [Macleaya cordata]
MALISQYMTQGSYATLNKRPKLWSKEVKLKPLVTLQMVGRLNRSASWKHHFFTSSQNDESGSIVSWNFTDLSDVTDDKAEETMKQGSSMLHESPPLSYYSSGEETKVGEGSPDIYELFKKLLMMLRTQEGVMPQKVKNQIGSREQEGVIKSLKAIWHYFLGLIKTILKIPKAILLLWDDFVITVLNGAEPTKEQISLWVLRTVTLYLYIKVMILLFGTMGRCLDVGWLTSCSRETHRFLKRAGFI